MSRVRDSKKRQDLPTKKAPSGWSNGLWIVATPIGNLGDMTARAREALEYASQIVCEDTRMTAQLLNALGIPAAGKLTRLDSHATPAQLKKVIESMQEGQSVALVTDAGTPSVSDPGSQLVRLAHENGVTVVPIPGASALATFLSVSGFLSTAFSFHGFFPRKTSEQKRALESSLQAVMNDGPRIHIWFESPQRIEEALKSLAEPVVPNGSRVCVAKELTKIHEQIWLGTSLEILSAIREHIEQEGERGEWVFGVEFEGSHSGANLLGKSSESLDWVKALHCLIDARIGASEAAKRVSQHFGIAKNDAYKRALEISGKIIAKSDGGA
jgi:16S rRNA (cytidine1402-2'-O)-methyltransferase